MWARMFTVRPTVGAESQEPRQSLPTVDGLIMQSHRVVQKKSSTGHINTCQYRLAPSYVVTKNSSLELINTVPVQAGTKLCHLKTHTE